MPDVPFEKFVDGWDCTCDRHLLIGVQRHGMWASHTAIMGLFGLSVILRVYCAAQLSSVLCTRELPSDFYLVTVVPNTFSQWPRFDRKFQLVKSCHPNMSCYIKSCAVNIFMINTYVACRTCDLLWLIHIAGPVLHDDVSVGRIIVYEKARVMRLLLVSNEERWRVGPRKIEEINLQNQGRHDNSHKFTQREVSKTSFFQYI